MSENCSGVDSVSDGVSALSVNEKGRNKRKFLSDPQFKTPVEFSSMSLTEFPRYEMLEEKFQNALNELSILERSEDIEEQDVEECQDDWDDPVTCQLEELLTDNLLATFNSAVRKIVESGYTEEAAERAILNSSYHGSKDAVSNIVDGAIAILKREVEFGTPAVSVFDGLHNLVDYMLLEMIYVLQEVRPSLSVSEAMWCLLINDLNVVSACVTEGGPAGGSCSQGASGENQTLSQSNSESSGTSQPKDPACVMEGGPAGGSCSQEASGESQTLSQAKSDSSGTNQSKNSNNSGSAKQIMSHDESSQPKTPAAAAASDSQPTNKQRPGELASPRKESSPASEEAKENTSAIDTEHIPASSEATAVDEKSGVSKKGLSATSKRDMLRQKAFQFEKNYKGRMSKGAFKAKVAAWGSMVLDKSLRSSSHVAMKEALSKLPFSSATISSVVESNNHPSSISPSTVPASCVKDHVFALPAENPKSHAPSVPDANCGSKGGADVSDTSKAIDYYALIPFDETQQKYLPEDDKDEAILLLVPHIQDLEKELQGWTAWANEKVMQAAQRLGKDKTELKMLRQEKDEVEKYRKDKQALEESTQKRLTEMEYALKNATNQIEMARRTIHRLEEDNKVSKKEMEGAKMQARSTATNLQKALGREQELVKRLQSLESERSLIQEKLTNLQRERPALNARVEKAKERLDQFKALWKQEEKEKLKSQNQIDSIRKKLEDEDAVMKLEEDKIKKNADNDKLKCEDDIKNLENMIAELRLEANKSAIAALSIGYGSKATGQPRSQLPKVAKRLAVFEDNFSDGPNVKPERECVMCLTEEFAVVFLPCAHQVLCGPCNALHEKQGMNDCPSCRTTIQERIPVTYLED